MANLIDTPSTPLSPSNFEAYLAETVDLLLFLPLNLKEKIKFLLMTTSDEDFPSVYQTLANAQDSRVVVLGTLLKTISKSCRGNKKFRAMVKQAATELANCYISMKKAAGE